MYAVTTSASLSYSCGYHSRSTFPPPPVPLIALYIPGIQKAATETWTIWNQDVVYDISLISSRYMKAYPDAVEPRSVSPLIIFSESLLVIDCRHLSCLEICLGIIYIHCLIRQH